MLAQASRGTQQWVHLGEITNAHSDATVAPFPGRRSARRRSARRRDPRCSVLGARVGGGWGSSFVVAIVTSPVAVDAGDPPVDEEAGVVGFVDASHEGPDGVCASGSDARGRRRTGCSESRRASAIDAGEEILEDERGGVRVPSRWTGGCETRSDDTVVTLADESGEVVTSMSTRTVRASSTGEDAAGTAVASSAPPEPPAGVPVPAAGSQSSAGSSAPAGVSHVPSGPATALVAVRFPRGRAVASRAAVAVLLVGAR
jgi:hypothetical protein